MSENRPGGAEKDATKNPYDVAHTCRCFAWSEGECACGGYVDRGKVRAWQQGYDAAVRDLTTRDTTPEGGTS